MGDKILPSLQTFQPGLIAPRLAFSKASAKISLICTNFGTQSQFITGRLLEEKPEIRDMKILHVTSWQNSLRVKTGGAEPFSFMLFPKVSFTDISIYIQIVDDIGITNRLNDLPHITKKPLLGRRMTILMY
ncbi:hypothetical protein CPB84DRAFT_1763573 [Gymnopilus junonius]|uniref:Uncharacterized protein n=1 Tax=Gymnopilus junonius TaxID=109634 RepID=A0A9P5P0N4_GYMJU|nr:hypothetical protein CPB84DRAFT_1763573 [Gymnopilus junonius]